jgi:hypothetical protein
MTAENLPLSASGLTPGEGFDDLARGFRPGAAPRLKEYHGKLEGSTRFGKAMRRQRKSLETADY